MSDIQTTPQDANAGSTSMDDDLVSENADLKSQLAQMEKAHNDVLARLTVREEKVLALSKQVERMEVKMAMTKKEEDEIISDLRVKNADLSSRNAHVEADMMNQLSDLAGTMQTQMDQLSKALTESKNRCLEYEEALKKKSSENETLNEVVLVMKRRFSDLEKEGVNALTRVKDRFDQEQQRLNERYRHERDHLIKEQENLSDQMRERYEEEIAIQQKSYGDTLQKMANKLQDREAIIVVEKEKVSKLEKELEDHRRETLKMKLDVSTNGKVHSESHELSGQLDAPPTPTKSDIGESMSVASHNSSVLSDGVLNLSPDTWKRTGDGNQTRLKWRRTPKTKRSDALELEAVREELATAVGVKDELQQKLFDYENQQQELVTSLETKLQERDSLISNLNSMIDRNNKFVTKAEDDIISLQKEVESLKPKAIKSKEAENLIKTLQWEFDAARESHAEVVETLNASLMEAQSAKLELMENIKSIEEKHKIQLRDMKSELQKQEEDHNNSLEIVSTTLKEKEELLDKANLAIKEKDLSITTHLETVSELREEQERLKSNVDDSKYSTERVSAQQYEAKICESEKVVEKLMSEHQVLKEKESSLLSDNLKLRESLNNALETLRSLTEETTSSTELEMEYLKKLKVLEDDKEKSNLDLQTILKEKEDAILKLQNSIDQSDGNVTAESQRLSSKDNNFSPHSSEEVCKLKENVAMLENKVNIMKGALNQFQASIDGKTVSAWDMIENLRHESELFASQVIEQEQELEVLTRELQDQKVLNQALSSDLEHARSQLQKQSETRSIGNDMMMIELEDEINQHLRDLKNERTKNNALMTELEDLKAEQENFKPALQKTLDTHRQKTTSLEQELEFRQEEIERLSKNNASLETTIDELNAELDTLSDRLQEKDEDNAKLPSNVKELQSKLRESEQSRLDFEKSALDDFNRKIVLMQLDRKVLSEKYKKLMNESDSRMEKKEVELTNQVASLEAEKKRLQLDLESKLRSCNNKLVTLEVELSNVKQSNKDLISEREQLRLSMSGVSEARKGEVEDMNRDLILANSELSKKSRELKNLQMSIGDLGMKHRHELKVLLDRITELENERPGEVRADEYADEHLGDNKTFPSEVLSENSSDEESSQLDHLDERSGPDSK